MKQFLSISEAATELDMSKQYIRNLINGILSNTPDRYYVSDVFNGGKMAVRFVALQDYAKYKGHLDTAPPYDPVSRERELGILPEITIRGTESYGNYEYLRGQHGEIYACTNHRQR